MKRGAGQGGEVNGGCFSLRLPVFPALLTRFRHFLTLLFEETPVSAPDWRESVVFLPGKRGRQHYYSGGFPEAQAGGCPEKGGRETGLVPVVRASMDLPSRGMPAGTGLGISRGVGGVQSTEAVSGSDYLFFRHF